MAIKVAVNGTGRIGLSVIKLVLEREDMELVAINTTAEPKMLEYLLKYDTVHRGIDAKVIDDNLINIGGKEVVMFTQRDINRVNFGSAGAEVVAECTGVFLTTEKAKAYLRDGVKKVVMSAPAKDDTPTFVLDINTDRYRGEAIISNASCTTNCLAPVCKVLDDAFGVENGLMTTIHSYTNDQNLLDVKHKKDFRRARAAGVNMIPTSTGAAKAIGLVMPHLKGKLNGFAVRVPTTNVSMVDLTVNLKKEVTVDEVNSAFRDAHKRYGKMILVDEDRRVSSDFIGCEYSAIFIPDLTRVVGDSTLKVSAWYDNEWGYSCRMVDMMAFVSQHS
jgi:glyceraldehyde 3-phosphate dehydrogenase